MSLISEVGANADSSIATTPSPAVIVNLSAGEGKQTSGAKSKKAPVAKAKQKLTPEEEKALITNAKDALAALDAHGDDYLAKMLAFGEAAHQAKASKPHGEFKNWCQQNLNRSPSWVSNYRRLFEERAYLQDALAWAREENHKWANCRSVERLSKVIAEFKARTSDETSESTTAPKPPQKAKEVIAELQHRLMETEEEFMPLRDLLPPEVMTQTRAWATASATGDAEAKEALAAFTQACHSRLRQLLADQTSSALEVSEPAPVAQNDLYLDKKADTSVAADQCVIGGASGSGTTINRDPTKSGVPLWPAAKTLPRGNETHRVTETGVPVKTMLNRKMH